MNGRFELAELLTSLVFQSTLVLTQVGVKKILHVTTAPVRYCIKYVIPHKKKKVVSPVTNTPASTP